MAVELREVAQASTKTIIEAIRELSIEFPQLKAMVEVISNVVSIFDVRVLLLKCPCWNYLHSLLIKSSQDTAEFHTLRRRLEAIMSIVQHYQRDGSMDALESRIKSLSPFVNA